jgi:hypothetical protein
VRILRMQTVQNGEHPPSSHLTFTPDIRSEIELN